MKRFALLITALLACNTLKADTITINWGVDSSIYDTTTCEIGNDVLLPTTPTKRGYIFRGWTAEHFDRGTFANYASIPQNANNYQSDMYNNQTPLSGDYITITEACDYFVDDNPNLSFETHSTGGETASIDVTVLGKTYNYFFRNVSSKTRIGNTNFFIQYSGTWQVSADVPMIINNVFYPVGSVYSWSYNRVVNFDASGCVNASTWKFVYDGVWEIDGKNGWKPDYQITSNQDE